MENETLNIKCYPGLKIRKDAWIVFETKIQPSFSPAVSFFLLKDAERHFVRRIIFQSAKLNTYGLPNYFAAEVELPTPFATDIVRGLEKIQITPFIRSNTIGLDGVTYEFKFEDYQGSTSIKWWCEPNNGTREFGCWYKKTIMEFQNLLPESEIILQSEPLLW